MNIRAEKTTPNADDFKVLLVGVIVCVLGIFVEFFGSRYHNIYMTERPFITAQVKVAETSNAKSPTIIYATKANLSLDATRISIIRDIEEQPLSISRSLESYHITAPGMVNIRRWSWNLFFENDRNSKAPSVPKEPFKVCVRFLAVTRDTLVHDESPEYCSDLFYPKT